MRIRNERRQDGSAVVVILALLVIVLAYVAFNLRTLESLNREVKLVEKRQLRRLQSSGPSTNSPALTNVTGGPVSSGTRSTSD